MDSASSFTENNRIIGVHKTGSGLKEDTWLEDMGTLIEAAVEWNRREQSFFSEYCQESNKKRSGLKVQNSQWLEEQSVMIEKTLDGIRKREKFSADSYEIMACA